MSKTELAWAAGFFDGEGCAYVKKNTTGLPYLRISMGQIDRYVLDRFCTAVGFPVARVNGPYYNGNRSVNPLFRLQFNGKNAILVVKLIWPYLSPVKKAQVKVVIQRCRSIRNQSASGKS